MPHGDIFGDRFLGELRRLRVADLRGQRRNERRAALEPMLALRPVGLDPFHAALRQESRGVREDRDGEQQVVRNHRHHDVQLELPRFRRSRDGHVVAQRLIAHHVHHLGDGRVHLPGHDARPGLDRGEGDLRQRRAWPGGEQPQVARDLAEIHRVGP